MTKFKKVLLAGTAAVMTAALAISGTMAYLTSDDSDVNVMTLGNVSIEQNEEQRVDVSKAGILTEADIEQFQKEIGGDSRIVLKRRTSKTDKETEVEEEPRRAYVFRANGEIETFDITTGKNRKVVGEVDKYGIAKFHELDEDEKSTALS